MNNGLSNSSTVASDTKTPSSHPGFFARFEQAAKGVWHKSTDYWHDGDHVDAIFTAVTLPQQSVVDAYAKPLVTNTVSEIAHGASVVAHDALPVINKEFVIIGGGLLIAGFVLIKGMQEANKLTGTFLNAV